MKKIALLAVFVVSTAIAKEPTLTPQAQVKQANANVFGAMVRRDSSSLQQRIAHDAVFIGATVSKTDSKRNFIARLLNPKESYESIIVENPQIKLQGETAVVIGRVVIKAKTEQGDNHVRMTFTNVFIKRDKRWQLIVSQTGSAIDVEQANRQK